MTTVLRAVNQVGSSRKPRCSCISFLRHAYSYGNRGLDRTFPPVCSAEGCFDPADDGGHVDVTCYITLYSQLTPVRKISGIVPLCSKHNHPTQAPFNLKIGTVVVDEHACKPGPAAGITGLLPGYNR